MLDPTAFGYGEFRFTWGDHICGIFETPSQQMQIMGGFITHGLRAAQRCVWVAPEVSSARFREMLGRAGADIQTLEASGQFVIVSDVEFYLKDNMFEPERTMQLLNAFLEEGQKHGYDTMRIATDMSWLRGSRLDPHVWEAFESKLTDDVFGRPVVLVCQYDRRQVSGTIVVAALRTHPIVILGDDFHHNPFYVPSEDRPAAAEVM